jgi:hypothetical protein
MTDVAMIVVAAAHMCTFAWLLFMRSSHGILCAFGSSVALVAALLWWHLVRPSTHARITLQTLGLGLAGLCLVVRTLLEHWFRRGVAGQPRAAGAAAGGADAGAVGDGALGQSYEGGQQKEVRLQIIGAEQWLIAWSVSSWASLLYAAPCVFAWLRQGVDAAMATFGCYLLFFTLSAQACVLAPWRRVLRMLSACMMCLCVGVLTHARLRACI